MIDTTVEAFRMEEASHARDLAYLMEDLEDDAIDACLEAAESGDPLLESGYDEGDTEFEALLESVDEMDDNEDEEIRRIMESEEGVSFDQMIGLDPITSKE